MKSLTHFSKLAVAITLLILFGYTKSALAFEAADCPSFVSFWGENDLKNKLENFIASATFQNNMYVMCFNTSQTLSPSFKAPITINNTTQYPLLIYGLNLTSTLKDLNTSTLVLSGQSITLDHVTLTTSGGGTVIQVNGNNMSILNSTLTGNGSGTAIQVNAPSPPPSPQGGEGVTVKNSTIDKFTTSINVAEGAGVKLSQNEFDLFPYSGNPVVFSGAISPIDGTLLGRHVSDADSSKVDYVKGKLNLDECAGTMEMYKNYKVDNAETYYLKKHTAANCEIQSDLKAKFDGGEEQTLACGFKCEDFTEDLSTKVVFVYSDANGLTKPFAPIPLISFNDMQSVITVIGGGFVAAPTGSEMGGDNYVDGEQMVQAGAGDAGGSSGGLAGTCAGENCISLDPGQQAKAQDAENNSGEEKINTSGASATSGCGGSLIDAHNPTLLQILAALIPIFAIPPLVYCKIKRRK